MKRKPVFQRPDRPDPVLDEAAARWAEAMGPYPRELSREAADNAAETHARMHHVPIERARASFRSAAEHRLRRLAPRPFRIIGEGESDLGLWLGATADQARDAFARACGLADAAAQAASIGLTLDDLRAVPIDLDGDRRALFVVEGAPSVSTLDEIADANAGDSLVRAWLETAEPGEILDTYQGNRLGRVA